MATKFELFRLSLLAREQIDLVSEYNDLNREEWLRKVFLEEQSFENRGTQFHYVGSSEHSDAEIIAGRIGKNVFREENRPPEEGLKEYTHDTWRAALLVLDPRQHHDGQKLALQRVYDVGQARVLIHNLVSEINQRYPYGPYSIEASQLIDSESFWNYVDRHSGKVTSVSFDFIPPNMFDSSDTLEEELRKYRDEERASKIGVTVQNPEGIDPNTSRIRAGVEYAEKGGGSVQARAQGETPYKSTDSVKQTSLEGVKLKGSDLLRAAIDLKDKILGR